MSTNPEKLEGSKAEKKKKASPASPKKLKVNSKLAIVQDVIALMDQSQINEILFEQAGTKIHLRKGPGMPFDTTAPVVISNVPAAIVPATGASVVPSAAVSTPAPLNDKTVTFSSPMVGTFYRAPSPDAKPFVEEGDKVAVGQVYCIIEAMKLMNEVKAEVAGKVVKILVQNGQAIEFNQPLLIVDPS
jgi:acetyl-CoA carboxylase biotin carboxyl carrier protein